MPGVGVRFRALTSKALRLEMASVEGQLEQYITDYLNGIKEKVSVYPPVPSNSRYVRTGHLQAAWNMPLQGSAFDRTLVVDTVAGGGIKQYARYVHGDALGEFQMPYHRANNWQNLYDHLDRPGYSAGLRKIYASARIK